MLVVMVGGICCRWTRFGRVIGAFVTGYVSIAGLGYGIHVTYLADHFFCRARRPDSGDSGMKHVGAMLIH